MTLKPCQGWGPWPDRVPLFSGPVQDLSCQRVIACQISYAFEIQWVLCDNHPLLPASVLPNMFWASHEELLSS